MDGSAYLMAYEPDDRSGEQLTGAVLQHLSAEGEVLFEWDAADHVDRAVEGTAGTNPDWAHVNSVEVMDDGDLLVSFRHLSAVLKVARTAHDGFAHHGVSDFVICTGYRGEVIKDPCRTCGGQGRGRNEKQLSVNIPQGVEEGTRIRLAGEGEAGLRGAPPGDLYIFLTLKPHRLFQRDGADIYCRVPISMSTASLGGSVEVPTLEGKLVRLAIPAGTPTGHQFRLKNKGMTVLRSSARGDMFVQALVETPVNLTTKQKELLKEFEQESSTETHSPQAHGFFGKVRELWEDLKE